MKYFTPEEWAAWQEPGYRAPPPEQEPAVLYRHQLEGLRSRLPARAWTFFASADVHDGSLLSFVVREGDDHAPVAGLRVGKRRRRYPVSAVLRVREGNSTIVWEVEYLRCRRALIDFPGVELFHEDGDGFGDWGYDELSDAGAEFLRHEILFASGTSLLVEFLTVKVRRLRPAESRSPARDVARRIAPAAPAPVTLSGHRRRRKL